jgi:hypothetical protein
VAVSADERITTGKGTQKGDEIMLTGQARLCAELLPYLQEIEERLPERTAEELQLISDMEKYHGRSLTEPEKNISIAQARMIGHIQD